MFKQSIFLLLAIAFTLPTQTAAQTGSIVPELVHFDRLILAILTDYRIPGAAVSIA